MVVKQYGLYSYVTPAMDDCTIKDLSYKVRIRVGDFIWFPRKEKGSGCLVKHCMKHSPTTAIPRLVYLFNFTVMFSFVHSPTYKAYHI